MCLGNGPKTPDSIRVTALSCPRPYLPFLWIGVAFGCSGPLDEPLSSTDLEAARQALKQNQTELAHSSLRSLDSEDFDRFAQGEYHLLAGDLAWREKEADDAIHHYREFLYWQGAAADSRVAEDRLYQLGMDLLEGRRKALGIFPDRTRGAEILRELAMWAPRSLHAAAGLAAVADWHFQEKRFLESSEDYRQILESFGATEFADIASFRIGLCQASLIPGPWVDADFLSRTRNQFITYLQMFPNGIWKTNAEEKVVELEELIARHHLELGNYYFKIGNLRGARQAWRHASFQSGTLAAEDAAAKLEDLPVGGLPLPGAEDQE